MDTTVVIPTYNEGANVGVLVSRLAEAFGITNDVEVLFVDDSTDDTSDHIKAAMALDLLPVRLLHRSPPERIGGLAGAVAAGIAAASGDYVIVMDGDLQHPPELAPELRRIATDADLAVASRYCSSGDASGLSSSWRRAVSSGSTLLARTCFPRRVGRVCTDPMTGFFCIRRSAVQLDRLRPRGFKILLEILARHDLKVIETPFVFGERLAGVSKASWRNGLQFLYQMASLRMGVMSRFAAVGALGTVVNLLVMGVLLIPGFGISYVVAAVVAAELSILQNFLLQERFVFRDLAQEPSNPRYRRLWQHFAFNNAEALVRLPILVFLVEGLGLIPLVAQAATLTLAFVFRFMFVSKFVYRTMPAPVLPLAPNAIPSNLKESA